MALNLRGSYFNTIYCGQRKGWTHVPRLNNWNRTQTRLLLSVIRFAWHHYLLGIYFPDHEQNTQGTLQLTIWPINFETTVQDNTAPSRLIVRVPRFWLLYFRMFHCSSRCSGLERMSETVVRSCLSNVSPGKLSTVVYENIPNTSE